MSTPITAAARRGRGAWAMTAKTAAGLAVAGLLAAGCGSTRAGSPAGSTSPSGGTPAAAPTATPVPTVTGGSVTPGTVACADWPAGSATGTLPASFVPVKVERCVNGAQQVAGRGLWVTAILQQADSGLAGLVSALRAAPGTHKPGTVCPALATIPPQIVLISETGQQFVPRLPVTGCGLTQSRVLLALGSLHWQTLSVRLVSPVPGSATPAPSDVTISGTPRGEQTQGAAAAG